MRFILLLASLATLLAPCAARATDYYVRTDGLDGNPGTSNSATGAFLTVRRCAQVAQAGDRCLVQSGTYLETPTNQANAGSLVGSALATCTCTRKSTSVTCMGAVPASITAGMFVRCSGAHGFAWSRVKSVNGASLSLSEPYRGASLTDAPLDAARFVEILGQGARPRDVVI
jgi:hypothetical protein